MVAIDLTGAAPVGSNIVLGDWVEPVQHDVPHGGRADVVTGTGDVAATDLAVQTLRIDGTTA